MLLLFVLFLSLSLFFGICQGCGDCKTGFIQVDNKCYKIYTEKKSWDEAAKICYDQESHHFILDKSVDREKLSNLLKSIDGCKAPDVIGPTVWTAGKRFGKDFAWEVAGGKTIEMNYKNWRRGEPNNSGGKENCVQMYQDLTFNDVPCGVVYCIVCQYDL